jgi:hypothetical protein
MQDRKDRIKRLRRLERNLVIGSIAGITLSFAADSTNHEKLAQMLAGATLVSAVLGCYNSIKKACLEYAQAEEEKIERERAERENNSYIKQDNNYNN